MIPGATLFGAELFSLVFVDAGMEGLCYSFARKLMCPDVPHTKLTFQQMIPGGRPFECELFSLVFVDAGMEGLCYSFARKLMCPYKTYFSANDTWRYALRSRIVLACLRRCWYGRSLLLVC